MAVDVDLELEDDEVDVAAPTRRMSVSHETKGIAFFGPRQASHMLFNCTFTSI